MSDSLEAEKESEKQARNRNNSEQRFASGAESYLMSIEKAGSDIKQKEIEKLQRALAAKDGELNNATQAANNATKAAASIRTEWEQKEATLVKEHDSRTKGNVEMAEAKGRAAGDACP